MVLRCLVVFGLGAVGGTGMMTLSFRLATKVWQSLDDRGDAAYAGWCIVAMGVFACIGFNCALIRMFLP